MSSLSSASSSPSSFLSKLYEHGVNHSQESKLKEEVRSKQNETEASRHLYIILGAICSKQVQEKIVNTGRLDLVVSWRDSDRGCGYYESTQVLFQPLVSFSNEMRNILHSEIMKHLNPYDFQFVSYNRCLDQTTPDQTTYSLVDVNVTCNMNNVGDIDYSETKANHFKNIANTAVSKFFMESEMEYKKKQLDIENAQSQFEKNFKNPWYTSMMHQVAGRVACENSPVVLRICFYDYNYFNKFKSLNEGVSLFEMPFRSSTLPVIHHILSQIKGEFENQVVPHCKFYLSKWKGHSFIDSSERVNTDEKRSMFADFFFPSESNPNMQYADVFTKKEISSVLF